MNHLPSPSACGTEGGELAAVDRGHREVLVGGHDPVDEAEAQRLLGADSRRPVSASSRAARPPMALTSVG